MKAVAQVVDQAQVKVNKSPVGRIDRGLLVFVAVHKDDTEESITKMAKKLSELKIFDDPEGKLKNSIRDVEGRILLISQFTLYADCHKGTTPNFSRAAPPEKGKKYYEKLVRALKDKNIGIETGRFGEFMEIDSQNRGPVTIIINT